MSENTRIYTVDKFLGLNEAADGQTELKMGQAARMENFNISDGYNLVTRGGIQRIQREEDRNGGTLLALWAGNVGGRDLLFCVDFLENDRVWVWVGGTGGPGFLGVWEHALGLTEAENARVKIFPFGGKVFIMSAGNTVYWDGEGFSPAKVYVPTVISGASPQGGGTELESYNLLSPLRRVEFSADGESTGYKLPGEATAIVAVKIDNEVSEGWRFDWESVSCVFDEAPVKGVANVEITYRGDPEQAKTDRDRVLNMTLSESYNGATDTRLFLAGDGSNVCIYSGVPNSGDITELYFPAMNEVAVDMGAGAVTDIVRSDNRLLVFTRSGADLITYEPVTLADGRVIAGFYLRNANREFGSEAPGQVQVTANKVRTLTDGGVYEWNFSAYYARDERHAKRISGPVEKSLQGVRIDRIVTCDDNHSRSYYAFLQDGRILVNRYGLEENIWCVYRSELAGQVRYAVMLGSTMVFAGEKGIFCLTEVAGMDDPETFGGEKLPIRAVWESGYMDFGADFRKKYSSEIYISMLPQSRSNLAITASTDRRENYRVKEIVSNIFSFDNASFAAWSFNMNRIPRIRRVRLKVKKFVYYKLIFRVEEPGSRATVLSYDMKVRFSSNVK